MFFSNAFEPIPRDLNINEIIRKTPKNKITVGELGMSMLQERYKPQTVTNVPSPKPIEILAVQPSAKSADIDAGIIRNAKTVRIPPTLTDWTTAIPNVK